MQIEISATEFSEEQAEEILSFLYETYHRRDVVDSTGRNNFIPIIRSYGFKGIAFTLYKILRSEETDSRVRTDMNALWDSELKRKPNKEDIDKFGFYLRFFGEHGKQELIEKIRSAEEMRRKARDFNDKNLPIPAEILIRSFIDNQDIPKSWKIYHEFGRSLYQQKKFTDAIVAYKNAVMLNTDEDNWQWSCDDLKWCFYYLYSADKIKEGIEFFQSVVKIFPNRWSAWHQLAWLYMNVSDYPKAIEYYKLAIELSGDKFVVDPKNWTVFGRS